MQLDGNSALSRLGRLTQLQPIAMKRARFVRALIGMRSEVVALNLEQIGWQALAAIAIIIRERIRKGWCGNSILRGQHVNPSPGFLGLVHHLSKIGV